MALLVGAVLALAGLAQMVIGERGWPRLIGAGLVVVGLALVALGLTLQAPAPPGHPYRASATPLR